MPYCFLSLSTILDFRQNHLDKNGLLIVEVNVVFWLNPAESIQSYYARHLRDPAYMQHFDITATCITSSVAAN